MNLLKPSVFVLSVLYTGVSFAGLAEKQGLTGEVSLIAAYSIQRSNFNTQGDKVKTGDLLKKGNSDSEFLVVPLGGLKYTFGNDLDRQVFIGTNQEGFVGGDLALEIGYSQELALGTVMSFAYLPNLMTGETWKDPYLHLNGAEKQTTDVSGNAASFKLSAIAGTNFSLVMAYGTTEIDDEQSASEFESEKQQLLDRNGSTVYLKSAYQYGIDQASGLIPSFSYISHSADGDAMSFDSFGAELTYFKVIEGDQISVTASYSVSSYDADDPLFSVSRSDIAYGLLASYEHGLGLDNYSFVSMIGYNENASNIAFYDESGLLAIIGLKYVF